MERKRKEELREKYEAIFSGDDDLHKRLRGTCSGSSSSNNDNNCNDIGIYKLFKL
jgi:hypothetical protein